MVTPTKNTVLFWAVVGTISGLTVLYVTKPKFVTTNGQFNQKKFMEIAAVWIIIEIILIMLWRNSK